MADTKRLFLTEADVTGLLDMNLALDALDDVFRARSAGEVWNEPRHRLPVGQGSYNFMAATWPERGLAGHKSYVAGSSGISFHVMLYSTKASVRMSHSTSRVSMLLFPMLWLSIEKPGLSVSARTRRTIS